ncbi:MAG: long-chain fatty acid--CoA ligase [Magnetococcus sp. DMHC-6]
MKTNTVYLTRPWRVQTLSDLFFERVEDSPQACAYRYFEEKTGQWAQMTWQQMADQVALWQEGLRREKLPAGARVAVLLKNSWQWVAFDQAALGLGLVVVPLYTNDRPGNSCYVIKDSRTSLLLLQNVAEWEALKCYAPIPDHLKRVVCLDGEPTGYHDDLLVPLERWLPLQAKPLERGAGRGEDLATIIYTSGTTGSPKGVMLSHANILANVYNSLRVIFTYQEDLFLSFLPLSHALERTAGYYLPMMAGAQVAFSRSIALLSEDLLHLRPTVLISVPRIFERMHREILKIAYQAPWWKRVLLQATVFVGWQRFLYEQSKRPWGIALAAWPLLKKMVASQIQNRLGGRLRVAVCGGAPLPQRVSRFLIGVGVPIVQGYGMTEFSPVISVNHLEDNLPESVGIPLPQTQIRLTEQGELLVKGPSVMMGYWKNPQATRQVLDGDGWLHTGDLARFESGHLHIVGRLKEIIVLANGRKVSPTDIESTIVSDPLFQQVLVIGEGAPYLSAMTVLDPDQARSIFVTLGLDPNDADSLQHTEVHQLLLARISKALESFPGFTKIVKITPFLTPWSVENGLLTPTLKVRRNRVMELFSDKIQQMYLPV